MSTAGLVMLAGGLALRRASALRGGPRTALLDAGAVGRAQGRMPASFPGPGPVWPPGQATEAAVGGAGQPQAGANVSEVPPAPTVPPTPPEEAAIPVVPAIDAAMKARLREVYARGRERGRQSGVFAKIGDSISVSTYFLADLGCGSEQLGDYAALAPTIEFFKSTALPGTSGRCALVNSFTRLSSAAGRGWIAVQLLTPMEEPVDGCAPPNDTPLRCEIVTVRPSVALVLLGTNDLHQGVGLRSYQASLATITAELIDAGVIPVLSTIPHRLDNAYANSLVADYNRVVRTVAAEAGVPLWNYWRALEGPDMVRGGMEPDGIHPNATGHGANLTARGLRYGYNQRNLSALQVLDKLRRIVMEDGPPDS